MSDLDIPAWPLRDKVYVSIVGSVLVVALVEWFLWLGTILYCCVQVFIKAEHWETQALATLMAFLFTALRFLFLPIMVVTLPLPKPLEQQFPIAVVSVLQWFGFWSFVALLTGPWLICIYHLVVHSVGRQKRIQEILDEHTAPKIVIVMPCYNEPPDVLIKAIDSIVDSDYPPSCMHVFLSFDGEAQGEAYLETIASLGVPMSLESYPKSIDVVYRTVRTTISRFPHGGKRHCQKATYKLISEVYTQYLLRNDNIFILFIDSDCILDRYCLQNFMYDMQLSPKNDKQMLAMTGVITSTTRKNNFLTILQDMEYVHGQLFERTVESGCGAVTCLPGALTMLRLSAFRKMAKYYFEPKLDKCKNNFDYWQSHLGEDRFLTHLFMVGAKNRHQIQMCTSAFCKTEAVQTFMTLVKQRRRWFLGYITNEVAMLTDPRIWRKYPALCVLRFMQNTIRTTSLLFLIIVVSLISGAKKIADLPVGFIGISLGLNWLMMVYLGFRLKRYKIWLYPLMFVLNPFCNWFYMVYAIFTSGERTWGGPRADAGAADATTTARQVVERAEELGDELNVRPETFSAAAEAQDHRPATLPVQPPDRIEGRFAPSEPLPGGWFNLGDDSTASVRAEGAFIGPSGESIPRRASGDSSNASVFIPRRVESIMGEEDRKKYALAQANQRAAGGAGYLADQGFATGQVYEMSEVEMAKKGFKESVESPGINRPGYHRDGRSTDVSPEFSPPLDGYFSPFAPFSMAAPPAVHSRPSSLARVSVGSPLARISYMSSASSLEEQDPQPPSEKPSNTRRPQ